MQTARALSFRFLAGPLFLTAILIAPVCPAEPARVPALITIKASAQKGESINRASALTAHPSAEDLFRAHFFEEPLVPEVRMDKAWEEPPN